MKTKLLIIFGFILRTYILFSANHISTEEALSKFGSQLTDKSFLAFLQVREEPLKWYDSIPESCLNRAVKNDIYQLKAQPGEIFVYQVGVWALKTDVRNLQLKFSDLKSEKGALIPGEKMTCYNLEGVNFKGKSFSKKVNIQTGRLQALWIGIDLENIPEGSYKGIVEVLSDGNTQKVQLELNISGEKITNHGYDRGAGLSRLNWLNSKMGIDEETTNGYSSVQKEGNLLRILGRTLFVGENGLPSSINSFFDGSNEQVVSNGKAIVGKPFRFIIELGNGEIIRLKPGKLTFTEQTPSRVNWKVMNTSAELELECSGQMEFDGFVDYQLRLTARNLVKVKDIRLEIPFEKDKAKYMMGLNHEGGYRTPNWKWKWDVSRNQDMLWLGGVNGGMRIKWKAENYSLPLVNIYYEFGPLKMPPSWENTGKGGVNVNDRGTEVLVNAYSGSRELKAGETLNFNFELLITPVKRINRNNKFNERYYHGGGTNTSVKITDAKKAGANIINIHHAEDIYPFINYPYLDANVPELKQLVSNTHQTDMRIKFYYTTRELTKNLPEFWPFYSLNGEVIFPGPGNATRTEALHPKGPNEWLVKNLREKYIPAWYNPVKEGKYKGELDLSVITTPYSRLNNFYVAGLDWMIRNLSIDGVYIDDSVLDRFTLRRARKLIDNNRPEGRIDMHSWNHFCQWAGFASCLNLYMDLLPYIDLVWIGEGRNYDRLPDHWLVEVSGIPFGLPGQMLEGGGNPWRGMVYGITTRAGWTPHPPVNLWKFFDDYRFSERNLLGYWEKDCPVRCSNSNIIASVYKGKNDVVIAVANWSDKDEETAITLNASALGLPDGFIVEMPEITDFQQKSTFSSLDKLIVPAKKGFLIVAKKK